MRSISPGTAFLLMTIAAISGCSNPETWKFREQVVMNTGELVTVERTALRNNVWPSLGGGGYQSIVNQWLSGPGVRVQWEAQRYGGQPMAIGRVDGKLHIVSMGLLPDLRPSLTYCQNHPGHYIVAFWKETPAGWERTEQSDKLLDQLTANLLVDLEWGDDEAAKVPLLTIEEKSRRSDQPLHPPPVLRQALDKRSGTTCRGELAAANWTPASAAQPSSAASAAR